MHRSIIVVWISASLAACGQSADESSTNAPSKASVPEKPKPAYCFFQDAETKSWAAKLDKDGNVVVSGAVAGTTSSVVVVVGMGGGVPSGSDRVAPVETLITVMLVRGAGAGRTTTIRPGSKPGHAWPV